MSKRCPDHKDVKSCFNDGGWEYCYICGKKLIKDPKCSCGTSLGEKYTYCTNCGKKVELECPTLSP